MPLSTTKPQIESSVKTMQRNNLQFLVYRKRDNVSIWFEGKIITIYKKKTEQHDKERAKKIRVLQSLVSRNINNFIKKNQFQVEEVAAIYKSTYTNINLWSNLAVGSVFFYVDCNHAYWRIAWLKTYIGAKLYNKYATDNSLKSERVKALACVIAPRVCDYYMPGKEPWRIIEDKSVHEQIHKNIRHTCWNMMGQLTELLDFGCYGYRTDGIMVPRHLVQPVKDYLESHNFLFTVKKCIKVNDKFYKYHPMHVNNDYDDRLRRFSGR